MSSPFFSIIIPTYNRADRLAQAITSVQAQTCTDWELLIVDDGSVDHTRSFVAQLTDSRIQYYVQPNAGKSAARNTGINHAAGQYLCFLDDDDLYLPEHLASVRQALSHTTDIGMVRSEAIQRTHTQDVPLPAMPHPGIRFIWNHGASPFFFAFHRHILEEFRFDTRFPFAQDVHLILRCLLHYPVIYTQQYTLVLVEHTHRSSHARTPDAIALLVAARLAVAHDLEQHYGPALDHHLQAADYPRWRSRTYLRAANLAFRSGHWYLGWRYNVQAMRQTRNWATLRQALRNSGHIFKPAP